MKKRIEKYDDDEDLPQKKKDKPWHRDKLRIVAETPEYVDIYIPNEAFKPTRR